MGRLEDVSIDDLHEALESITASSATLRIVVGLNYKHGVSQTEMAEWYGVSRSTIHNWLTDLKRINDTALENVVCDDSRPGRPQKIDRQQRCCLQRALTRPPRSVGYDEPEWTPELLQQYIDDQFDVQYSKRHTRTLLSRLGPDQTQCD